MSIAASIHTKDLKALIPLRTKTSNKSHGGKCLVIAGSRGLWGASYLCSKAALRVGAGYVYLSSETKDLSQHPDFLSARISTSMKLDVFSTILIGPGLKPTLKNKKLFHHIERNFEKPVVIDAGALPLITKLKPNWIITPHEGELSKLLNMPADEIRKDRVKAIKIAQNKFGGIIILKGNNTLIAHSSKIYKVMTGNKALAKAGTGDVLAGMISGFLSQGVKPIDAAILACGLHGHLADLWIKNKDYLSLMASDLIEMIPNALFTLRKKNK